MPRAIRPSVRRRSSGQGHRGRRRRGVIGPWAAGLFIGLAFAGGWAWHYLAVLRAERVAVEVSGSGPEQQAAARELLERAVEARHGELTNEALRLAMEARAADPDVPGAGIFMAEMALRQGDLEATAAAARAALEQRNFVANAQLLLALNAWMERRQTGAEVAGLSATKLLAEASEEELSNGAVRFFAGDLQRAIGRPGEAHRSLLGGLYRQQVWQSAGLLAAKLALTVDEAGPRTGAAALFGVGEESELFATKAVALSRALRGQGDVSGAMADSQAVFTQKQFAVLTRDPALAAARGPAGAEFFLPFGAIDPPPALPEAVYRMPWEEEDKKLDTNDLQLPEDALGLP